MARRPARVNPGGRVLTMVANANYPNIGTYRRIRLKPNAKGYYEIWWTDRDSGSITRRQSTKTKDRVEAESYLAAFCDDARGAIEAAPAVQRTPTVDALCAQWLAYAAGAGKTAGLKYILVAIRKHLGGYTPDQLTGPVADYPRQRAGFAGGTIRRELGGLLTVLRWAVRQKLIEVGSVPSFDGLLPSAGAPRTKFLDQVQEQWFWDQARAWGGQDHGNKHAKDAARRVALFIALALETSARKGAIMELSWDRVNLALGMIDYQVPGRRLTKKRRVRLPISDRLMPVLTAAAAVARKDGSGQAIGPVLEGITDLRGGFGSFTRAIDMTWVTPHVLRHTWASLAAMNGVSLRDIGLIMGDSTATIEATYLHLTPGHLRGAINHKTLKVAA